MSPLKTLSLAALLSLIACADVDQLDVGRDERDAGADLAEPERPDASADEGAADMAQELDQPPDMRESEDMAADMTPDTPPDMEPPGESVPARYPASAAISPVTAATQARWAAIRAARADGVDERVFMKVGASGTVSDSFLKCFEPGAAAGYELGDHAALQPVIDHFSQVRVSGGATSFGRATEAAQVGKTARWAITGAPSPLERELDALNARFAFVNYGTNDMEAGASYEAALWPFWTHMNALLDALEGRGVIPIITGLNPRADKEDAARWVPIYDAVTRGLAEQRQLPYLSLYLATKDMQGSGLGSDGLHGNVWRSGGQARPCHLVDAALGYNYNLRNLESLRMLDRVWRAVVGGEPAPDVRGEGWSGVGTHDEPILVDALPFTHHATTRGAARLLDGYPGCDQGQDEGGGEVYYRLVLERRATVRLMAFDGEADVDVHLLGADGDPQGCVARHDRTLERELEPGTYTIVVDSYVSGGQAREGDFLFVVVER